MRMEVADEGRDGSEECGGLVQDTRDIFEAVKGKVEQWRQAENLGCRERGETTVERWKRQRENFV